MGELDNIRGYTVVPGLDPNEAVGAEPIGLFNPDGTPFAESKVFRVGVDDGWDFGEGWSNNDGVDPGLAPLVVVNDPFIFVSAKVRFTGGGGPNNNREYQVPIFTIPEEFFKLETDSGGDFLKSSDPSVVASATSEADDLNGLAQLLTTNLADYSVLGPPGIYYAGPSGPWTRDVGTGTPTLMRPRSTLAGGGYTRLNLNISNHFQIRSIV